MKWILGTGPVPRLVVNKDNWDKVIGAEAGTDRITDGNTWYTTIRNRRVEINVVKIVKILY